MEAAQAERCAAFAEFHLQGCEGDLRGLDTLPHNVRSKIKAFTEDAIPGNAELCLTHIQALGKKFKVNCANPFGHHPSRTKGRPVKGSKFLEIVRLRDGLIQPLDSLCGNCSAEACTPPSPQNVGVPVQLDGNANDAVEDGGNGNEDDSDGDEDAGNGVEDGGNGIGDDVNGDEDGDGDEEDGDGDEDDGDGDEEDVEPEDNTDEEEDGEFSEEEDFRFSDQKLSTLNKIRRILKLSEVTYGRRNTAGKEKLVRDSAIEIGDSLCKLFGVLEPEKQTSKIDNIKLSVVLEDLNKKLQNSIRKERIRIAALFAGSLSLEQLKDSFGISIRGARIAKKLKDEPVLTEPPRKTMQGITKEVERIVHEFYLDNDNSKQSPNARDVSMIIDEDGTETPTTKRYLLKSVGEIYASFKAEDKTKDIRIGRTKFFQLRPPHCKLLKETKNQVCLCIYHENVRLLFDAVGLKFSEYLEHLVCTKDSKNCMFRRCEQCNTARKESDFGEKVKADILAKMPRYEHLDVQFNEWSTTGRELMVKCTLEIDDFVTHLTAKVVPFLRHHFTSVQQGSSWKQMKNTLDQNTAVIQCDFAENYTTSYNMEVSRAFYNQQQTTIHPFVVTVLNKDGIVENSSYVVISDELQHNASTYYVFQRNVIAEVKKDYTEVKSVQYWSDGAGSQYKNFKNMANLKHHMSDNGLYATHNFFASCHGKGPCDAVGGVVKSCVRRAAQAGKIIQEPREVYEYVQEKLKKYKFLFVSAETVHEVIRDVKLEERYAEAVKIPRIREMHRIVANENTMDLYELSSDPIVCCTLTYEERFDASETDVGDWVAAIYDEKWYFGIVQGISQELEELHIQFLKNEGTKVVSFTKQNYEQNTTCVPFCRVISKVETPTSETSRGRGSRTFKFAPGTRENINEKFMSMK